MPTAAERRLRERIAANVRHWREARELSQAELAELAGCQPLAIARFETAALSPSLKTLAALSDALEVDAAKLLAKRKFRARRAGRPKRAPDS